MKTEEANKKVRSSHKEKEEDHKSSEAVSPYDEHTDKLIAKQASTALLCLLFFSILMFTLPFAAFFGTQHLLRIYSDYADFTITAMSVAASVVTVYLIIFLYVYIAYKEKDVVIPESKKIN